MIRGIRSNLESIVVGAGRLLGWGLQLLAWAWVACLAVLPFLATAWLLGELGWLG